MLGGQASISEGLQVSGGVSDTSYSSFLFLPDKILLNLKKKVQ